MCLLALWILMPSNDNNGMPNYNSTFYVYKSIVYLHSIIRCQYWYFNFGFLISTNLTIIHLLMDIIIGNPFLITFWLRILILNHYLFRYFPPLINYFLPPIWIRLHFLLNLFGFLIIHILNLVKFEWLQWLHIYQCLLTTFIDHLHS